MCVFLMVRKGSQRFVKVHLARASRALLHILQKILSKQNEFFGMCVFLMVRKGS